MACKDRLSLIEEWIDGELSGKDTLEMEEHLKKCLECSNLVKELKREQALYTKFRQMQPLLEPSPRIWGAIYRDQQSRWVGSRTSWMGSFVSNLRQIFCLPRLSPALGLALVVCSIGITVFVMHRMLAQKENSTQIATHKPEPAKSISGQEESSPSHQMGMPARPKEVAPTFPETGAFRESNPRVPQRTGQPGKSVAIARKTLTVRELIRRAERDYETAIAILERDLRKRPSPLDPKVKDQFELAMAAVNMAIAETQKSLRMHPDDPVAVQYMMAAYAQKVGLLEEMVMY
jgi:hypothetical protein